VGQWQRARRAAHVFLELTFMDITIALQRAVRAFPLGSAALAARLGISPTSLAHKVSPTYPAAHASVEEACEIMEITNDHAALHAMAARLGYVLLPAPGAAVSQESLQAMAATVREFGEFCFEVAGSVADGHVTDNERARVEAEAADTLGAIEGLLAVVVQHLNEAPKAQKVAA
jgi:hypothetical protein